MANCVSESSYTAMFAIGVVICIVSIIALAYYYDRMRRVETDRLTPEDIRMTRTLMMIHLITVIIVVTSMVVMYFGLHKRLVGIYEAHKLGRSPVYSPLPPPVLPKQTINNLPSYSSPQQGMEMRTIPDIMSAGESPSQFQTPQPLSSPVQNHVSSSQVNMSNSSPQFESMQSPSEFNIPSESIRTYTP